MDADLTTHRIEGMAIHGNTRFSVPLISEFGDVLGGTLYHGGCIDGVDVKGKFDVIVSLYPWEKYAIDSTTLRYEIRMYDAQEIPSIESVTAAAELVAEHLREGKRVLVHCQAGLNRSSLVVGTMLVINDVFTPQDAVKEIRARRSEACLCNSTFERFVLDLA